jgi:hypothetical protein
LSKRVLFLGAGLSLLLGVFGCAGSHVDDPESALPADVRADYAVFALRCSKCHSLARPLNSGIDTDEYWKMYVERMRRQPASGISVADTVPILRFLHVFSIAERKRKQEQEDKDSPVPAAPLADAGTAPVTGAH